MDKICCFCLSKAKNFKSQKKVGRKRGLHQKYLTQWRLPRGSPLLAVWAQAASWWGQQNHLEGTGSNPQAGRYSMPNMTGRPGHQTMDMNGGSSAPYLACTPCVPLLCTLFNKGGSTEDRRAFRLPGAGGDHFHCAVEPSPGQFRCRDMKNSPLPKEPGLRAARQTELMDVDVCKRL